MRLELLFRIRFTHHESWAAGLSGGWPQMFYPAEGRCEGTLTISSGRSLTPLCQLEPTGLPWQVR